MKPAEPEPRPAAATEQPEARSRAQQQGGGSRSLASRRGQGGQQGQQGGQQGGQQNQNQLSDAQSLDDQQAPPGRRGLLFHCCPTQQADRNAAFPHAAALAYACGMATVTALPLFHLYGDPPDDQAFDFIHVETIASRSSVARLADPRAPAPQPVPDPADRARRRRDDLRGGDASVRGAGRDPGAADHRARLPLSAARSPTAGW